MTTLRNKILANIHQATPKTRPVTCEELENFLGAKHQSVSAQLAVLRKEGIIFVSSKRTDSRGSLVNAYRLVVDYQEARRIDKGCGPQTPRNVTRDAVVAYLAACTEDEWNETLTEAAKKALI